MNRREALTGALAASVVSLPVAAAAEDSYEDKYWEAQWLISELEEARLGPWVSYTVEGIGPDDRVRAVRGFAQAE